MNLEGTTTHIPKPNATGTGTTKPPGNATAESCASSFSSSNFPKKASTWSEHGMRRFRWWADTKKRYYRSWFRHWWMFDSRRHAEKTGLFMVFFWIMGACSLYWHTPPSADEDPNKLYRNKYWLMQQQRAHYKELHDFKVRTQVEILDGTTPAYGNRSGRPGTEPRDPFANPNIAQK